MSAPARPRGRRRGVWHRRAWIAAWVGVMLAVVFSVTHAYMALLGAAPLVAVGIPFALGIGQLLWWLSGLALRLADAVFPLEAVSRPGRAPSGW